MKMKRWSRLAGGAFLSIEALSSLLHLALLFLNHTCNQRGKGIGLTYWTLNVIIEKTLHATVHVMEILHVTPREAIYLGKLTQDPLPLVHP